MIGRLSKNFFMRIPNNTFAKVLSKKHPKFIIIPSQFINKNDYYQFIMKDHDYISCKFNEDFYLDSKETYKESYNINIKIPHQDCYIFEGMYYNKDTCPNWFYSLDVCSYKHINLTTNDKNFIVNDFLKKF